MAQDRLEEYRDRRSSTSPEPAGSSGPAGSGRPTSTQNESVLSGRTNEDLEADPS